MDDFNVNRYKELKLKRTEHEKTIEVQQTLEQPLAFMVQGGYDCGVEPDGTEYFTNGNCKIRVPPSCVEWIHKPILDEKALKLTREEMMELQHMEKWLQSLST